MNLNIVLSWVAEFLLKRIVTIVNLYRFNLLLTTLILHYTVIHCVIKIADADHYTDSDA